MPIVPNADGDRPTLFLSYARADRPRAEKLAATLEQAGFTLWWDALIEGGAQFAARIGEALDRADAVIVLWSQHSIGSDWVRDEASQGRDAHRLVPLSLDGSAPPLGFRQYHAIDLRQWNGRSDAPEIAAIARAVAAIGSGAGSGATPSPIPARLLAPAGPSRRSALALGAGVLVLAGGGATVAWQRGLFGGADPAIPGSIAVLPLKNFSGNPEQAYFSDGLTEELRTALRRLGSLEVMGAASSDTLRDSKDDAKVMARNLGVAFLLEGSVQRAGDVVRIAIDLIDGGTGFSRWSNRLDRKMTDIFAVQTEIAQTVAQALSVQIATASPAPGGTTNADAYENFLKGRALFNQGKDEATDRAALADHDLALAADPMFALAHATRSRSLAAIAGEYAAGDQIHALIGQAIAAASRAIAIAPDVAEGQLAMGFALFTGRLDVARAAPFYDKAYQLGHGNADILLLFALYCSRAGRDGEARAAIVRAVALDPLNPRAHRATGSIAYAARRYRDAIPPIERALALNPALSNAHFIKGYSLMMLGDLPAAKAEILVEPHATFRLAGLAILLRRMGNIAGAKRAMEQMIGELGSRALYQQAQVYAQWGELDPAIAALAKAHATNDSGLIYLATDPLLDPLRKDPRFVQLSSHLPIA